MSGVALIYTPSASAEMGIQVFYPTANNHLAVAQRSASSKADPRGNPVYEVSSRAPTGPLANPTFLAAAPVSGVNLVVGITTQPVANPTSNDVSIISPVYQVIDSISIKTNYTLAMCCDGDQSAWVYYLDYDSNSNIVLKEYAFNSTSLQSLSEVNNIVPNSALATIYNTSTGNRYVYYQNSSDNKIFEYEASDPNKDPIHLPVSAANSNGSALAALYVEEKQKQYLYFTDNDRSIWRVDKPDTSTKWGNSTNIETKKIAATSQLSAVYANGIIHLLYGPENERGQNFEHYKDSKL